MLHYLLGLLLHVHRPVLAFVDFVFQQVEVLHFVDLQQVLRVLLPLDGPEPDVAIVKLGIGLVLRALLERSFQFGEFYSGLGGGEVERVVAWGRIEVSDFK